MTGVEGTGQGTVTAVSYTTRQESLVKRDQITWDRVVLRGAV